MRNEDDFDLEEHREMAEQEIQTMIDELDVCLRAAVNAREGIKTNSPTVLAEALRSLANHTDGHWYRLVLGKGTIYTKTLLTILQAMSTARADSARTIQEDQQILVKPQPESKGRMDGVEI